MKVPLDKIHLYFCVPFLLISMNYSIDAFLTVCYMITEFAIMKFVIIKFAGGRPNMNIKVAAFDMTYLQDNIVEFPLSESI